MDFWKVLKVIFPWMLMDIWSYGEVKMWLRSDL